MASFALCCVDNPSAGVDRLFHYAVPPEYASVLTRGTRVIVPFGAGNKPTAAYIVDFSDEPGVAPDKIKAVAAPLDDFAVFTDETLALAVWMRGKYYSTLISCLKCVQPPGLPEPGKPARKRAAEKTPAAAAKTFPPDVPPELTGEQRLAVATILNNLKNGPEQPVLLHGVTGSGKTEVYLRILAAILEQGRQAIVLVPEIALTPQAVGVFTGRFGGRVGVTHSRLPAAERLRLWRAALDGGCDVMVGPRSAVFTPFKNLGLIIVDEEHEHTYRSENTPKYDARAVARKRAELTGALVVVGSATPSLETYHSPDFLKVTLAERVNRMFPEVIITDMRRELAEGNTSVFSRALRDAMTETLAGNKQIILLINRRGHSTFVSCRWCGHVLSCGHCNVNYTWHSSNNRLLCHYCGKSERPPETCPACGSRFIKYFGSGTQRVEEELAALFPDAPALRMDMDTTRGRNGHEKLLTRFKNGEARILLGTQMIAKGLDFPNVTLVGVIAADLTLFTGDFRAGEYTFQLLTQVSGRAGRAQQSGRVFLQTYNPEHYALQMAKDGDYAAFYAKEIAIRRTMNYPPFSHVFMVLFTGPDEKALIKTLHKLLAVMRYCDKKEQFEILGPTPAFVSKIKKRYRWKLLLLCGSEDILIKFVIYCIKKLRANDPMPGITAHLTLDPVTLE